MDHKPATKLATSAPRKNTSPRHAEEQRSLQAEPRLELYLSLQYRIMHGCKFCAVEAIMTITVAPTSLPFAAAVSFGNAEVQNHRLSEHYWPVQLPDASRRHSTRVRMHHKSWITVSLAGHKAQEGKRAPVAPPSWESRGHTPVASC